MRRVLRLTCDGSGCGRELRLVAEGLVAGADLNLELAANHAMRALSESLGWAWRLVGAEQIAGHFCPRCVP